MKGPSGLTHASFAALAAIGIAACSPTLDWREFVPEGTDITVSFPCRPDRQTRQVSFAATKTRMEMLTCSAGEATFALAFIDLDDPTRVGAVLDELRKTAVRNVAGGESEWVPAGIRGMTPNPMAGRITIAGRFPDGVAVEEHAVFFTHGLRVFQATVIGARPAPQAVETFMAALRFAG